MSWDRYWETLYAGLNAGRRREDKLEVRNWSHGGRLVTAETIAEERAESERRDKGRSDRGD